MTGDRDVGALPTVLQSGEPAGVGVRLEAGARAGDYVIERYLGGGAMGEVYAGHHPVIGKKVAIKVIRQHLAASPEAVARFTREARAGNQVDHPNVVDVFAMGRLDDGRLYLVMDLVEGDSLRARVARGRLAPVDALAVLEPIAAALDAAHARGVVHRDLKPDNVMVSGPADRPAVHVLDFGIAKLVSSVAGDDGRAIPAGTDRKGWGTVTAQGTWLGTPAYMAPEQWSADGAIPASDRYALAAMTYELLTGAPPFAASTAPGLMEKHFRAEVPSITGAGVAVPAAVDAVVRRGLAKDPERRYASAAAMIDALRAAIGTQAGQRRAAAATTTASGRGPRRSPLPLYAGGVGVVVTAVGMWIVMRDRRTGTSDRDPAPTGRTAEVLSTPPGATILVDGVEVGVTPREVDIAPGGSVVAVRKPGYEARERTVVAGDTWPASLVPVDGFEGTWALPSGELRRFVRHGETVIALRLAAASEPGTFYRRFEFAPSTGAITSFVAQEEHVEPGHDHEPTCHVPLRAQYDYDTGGDELELRKERAQITVSPEGKCVLVATAWGEPRALTRIDRAADVAWAESRAGGVLPVNSADVVANPGFEPKEPLADDEKQTAPPSPKPINTKPVTKPKLKPAKAARKVPDPAPDPATNAAPSNNLDVVAGGTDQLDGGSRAINQANPPAPRLLQQAPVQAAPAQQAPMPPQVQKQAAPQQKN